MGDSVLERNLCFVDTPGYGNKTSVSRSEIWMYWLIQQVSGMYYAGCGLCGITFQKGHFDG